MGLPVGLDVVLGVPELRSSLAECGTKGQASHSCLNWIKTAGNTLFPTLFR